MRKFRFRQDVARPSRSGQQDGVSKCASRPDDRLWKNEGAFSEDFAAKCLDSRLRCGEVSDMARRAVSPSAVAVGCIVCANVLPRDAVKELMAASRARLDSDLAACPVCDSLSLVTIKRIRELGGVAPVAALLRFLYQRSHSAFKS